MSLSISDTSHASKIPHNQSLKTLDGLQEYFWLSEISGTHAAIIAAEVEGAVSLADWHRAAEALNRNYPVVSTRIKKNPAERPYFEHIAGGRVGLEVIPGESLDVDHELAAQMALSFGLGQDGLVRIRILHGPQRSLVVLAAHHAGSDGKTVLMMIRDFIAAASSEDIGAPIEFLPSLSQRLDLPLPAPYTHTQSNERDGVHHQFQRSRAQVSHAEFAPDELAHLLKRCREERTTLQGALVTAFILAGRELSPSWCEHPVVCLSPIDLRPVLKLGGVSGVPLMVHPTVAIPEEIMFWDFARRAKAEISKSQTREGAIAAVQYSAKVVRRKEIPTTSTQSTRASFFIMTLW